MHGETPKLMLPETTLFCLKAGKF